MQADAELVALAGTGDERAFNLLVHRHAGFVHSLALRYLQSTADADEVAQGVFLALWRAAARWTPDAKLRTWLYRVTVNRCIDRARARRRWSWLTGHGEQADIDIADPAPTAARRIEGAAWLAQVRAAMLGLPPRQRMALTLVAGEEKTQAEAAELMGITEGALEQLLVRARAGLRQRLESDDDR